VSPAVEVEQLFDEVAERLLTYDASFERGRMFSSIALKRGGKVFALCSRGEVVVKLPAERVDELIDAGGRRFDPGHGRLMREWVSVKPSDATECETLLVEARTFRIGKANTRG
jgi:TfoX N-terminal domain